MNRYIIIRHSDDTGTEAIAHETHRADVARRMADQGTNVNTAIVVFVAPAPARSTSPTAAPAATLFD